MLSTGTGLCWATSLMYWFPKPQSHWRMAMPLKYEPKMRPISLAVSPCEIWVVSLSMNAAWPPSCAMPASNEPRVRVLVKKNSMASVLSRNSGCGLPARYSFFSRAARSRTASVSGMEKSRSPMKSRPVRSMGFLEGMEVLGSGI